MLRIYSFIIETLRLLVGLFEEIARDDSDLGRQLRRAGASMALNVAEGMGVSGGNQKLRFRTALGSAREVGACLDVAELKPSATSTRSTPASETGSTASPPLSIA